MTQDDDYKLNKAMLSTNIDPLLVQTPEILGTCTTIKIPLFQLNDHLITTFSALSYLILNFDAHFLAGFANLYLVIFYMLWFFGESCTTTLANYTSVVFFSVTLALVTRGLTHCSSRVVGLSIATVCNSLSVQLNLLK